MEVNIRSAAKNSLATGKTTRTKAQQVKFEPVRSTWGNHVGGFRITGEAEETKGTGERGGVMTTYDKQAEVVLNLGEIGKLFAAVLKEGIYVLPGQEQLADAYLQLKIAQKSMAKAFEALGMAIPVAEEDDVVKEEDDEDDFSDLE